MLARSSQSSRMSQPKWSSINRYRSTITPPPSYFSEHLPSSPSPIFNEPSSSSSTHVMSSPSSSQIPYSSQSESSSQSSSQAKLNTIRGITMIITISTISYFAIDNYRGRVGLESKMLEQSMNHMKALAITQNNFNQQRRKRDTQVLTERRNAQKREMKMVYHISMLRKQLIDAGLKPTEIDDAIFEFEKNVKMENSISNVSGTALWVVDESREY